MNGSINFLDLWIRRPDSPKWCRQRCRNTKRKTPLTGGRRTFHILKHFKCLLEVLETLIKFEGDQSFEYCFQLPVMIAAPLSSVFPCCNFKLYKVQLNQMNKSNQQDNSFFFKEIVSENKIPSSYPLVILPNIDNPIALFWYSEQIIFTFFIFSHLLM